MAVGLVQELNIALIFQMCWPLTARQAATERNSVKSHSCFEELLPYQKAKRQKNKTNTHTHTKKKP